MRIWSASKAGSGTKAKSITSCHNTFVTNLVLLLPLRWHCAFAQKTSVAAATLALRFRTKKGLAGTEIPHIMVMIHINI